MRQTSGFEGGEKEREKKRKQPGKKEKWKKNKKRREKGRGEKENREKKTRGATNKRVDIYSVEGFFGVCDRASADSLP